MLIRRWESLVLFERGEKLEGERAFRRHITQRGARNWAKRLAYNPTVLAKTLETALHGPMVFVNPAVRDRKTGQIVWQRTD